MEQHERCVRKAGPPACDWRPLFPYPLMSPCPAVPFLSPDVMQTLIKRQPFWGPNPEYGWPDLDFVYTGGEGCGDHSPPGVVCFGTRALEPVSGAARTRPGTPWHCPLFLPSHSFYCQSCAGRHTLCCPGSRFIFPTVAALPRPEQRRVHFGVHHLGHRLRPAPDCCRPREKHHTHC